MTRRGFWPVTGAASSWLQATGCAALRMAASTSPNGRHPKGGVVITVPIPSGAKIWKKAVEHGRD